MTLTLVFLAVAIVATRAPAIVRAALLYAAGLYVAFGFITGAAAEKAYEINTRMGWMIPALRDKNNYRAFCRWLGWSMLALSTVVFLGSLLALAGP